MGLSFIFKTSKESFISCRYMCGVQSIVFRKNNRGIDSKITTVTALGTLTNVVASKA